MEHILIVKPDHIGDYILFRNILSEIKTKHTCTITCILNNRTKDLALFLDKNIIDNFVFIDLQKYMAGDWYYKRKNQEIFNFKYDTIINAMLSNFEKLEETIKKLDAKKKFMLYESMYDKKKYLKNRFGPTYTKLINTSITKEFEFNKFKLAFNKIFQNKISILKPTISLPNIPYLKINFTYKYVIIFIGSDAEYRKWSIYKYIEVIKYILEKSSLHIILCGSNEELNEAFEIEANIKSSRFHNLVNQTSLVDMLYLVKKSEFVISNETGIAHISAVINKYTIVISNANHFGKFTPYPKDFTDKYFGIYPFEIKDSSDYEKYKKLYYSHSKLEINTIGIDSVINKIDLIFNLLNIHTNYVYIPKKALNTQFLSPSQINMNFNFSSSFSNLNNEINNLKKMNQKYLIYGNGTVSKLLLNNLEKQCIGIIDKNIKGSFNNLKEPFDKIIISVLGRENEIEKILVNKYNIPTEKIFKFKIIQGRYIVRTK